MVDPTNQITMYHVDNGKTPMYPADAIDALTYWPDHWKVSPWTDTEKKAFAKKPKSAGAAEVPRWRVKNPISIGGSIKQAGTMIENYRGQPHDHIEPINEAARIRDKNNLAARATIKGIIDRFVTEQQQATDDAYRAEQTRGVPERLHAPNLP